MSMTIWAETTVSAAHKFMDHPIHGHTYHVRVYIDGEVDAEEFLEYLRDLRKRVDHKYLNDIFEVPSMENLARWFAAEVCKQYNVKEVAITRGEGVGCRLVIS